MSVWEGLRSNSRSLGRQLNKPTGSREEKERQRAGEAGKGTRFPEIEVWGGEASNARKLGTATKVEGQGKITYLKKQGVTRKLYDVCRGGGKKEERALVKKNEGCRFGKGTWYAGSEYGRLRREYTTQWREEVEKKRKRERRRKK